MNEKSILVFQTDFTYKEGAAASMYGVVKSVDRSLEIIDATHEIPQYDIWSASFRLYQYMRFWPEGTVFVSVVDPGVGTQRKACAARTSDGYYIITPDNGTLTHVLIHSGIDEIREIDEKTNRLRGYGTENISVFHGRDLFSYCAAKLASGIISFSETGPQYPAEEIVSFDIGRPVFRDGCISGIIEIADPNFGNIWTNIPYGMFEEAGFVFGSTPEMKISHEGRTLFCERILFERSFGFSSKGGLILYINELNNIAAAVSQGNMLDKYSLGYGNSWEVTFSE